MAIVSDYPAILERLPAEILAAVFVEVVLAMNVDDGVPKYLIAITHVCQRWLAVSTTCPFLWTEISLDRPHLARLSLARSSDLPLTINSREVSLQTVAELLNAHMHRLFSMSLDLQIPSQAEMIQTGLLWPPAPILIQLTIIGPSAVDLSKLFAGTTPALQSLTLERISLVTPALRQLPRPSQPAPRERAASRFGGGSPPSFPGATRSAAA